MKDDRENSPQVCWPVIKSACLSCNLDGGWGGGETSVVKSVCTIVGIRKLFFTGQKMNHSYRPNVRNRL